MLVLTRRENDRIIFPALGISVEVMKLGRTRASIGVRAPRGIRVIRHELLADGESSSSGDGLIEAVRRQLVSRIDDDLNAAALALRGAENDLAGGRTEAALDALGQALARLDRIRSKPGDLGPAAGQCPVDEQACETPDADPRPVEGTVAETAARYATSVTEDPSRSLDHVVLSVVLDGGEGDFFAYAVPSASASASTSDSWMYCLPR